MRLARLVFSLYGYYVLALFVDAFPTRMPIGAVFDHRSTHAYTAMKYEIEKYNNSSHSTFKLDKYERNISVSNSYALSKAVCNLMATGVLALFGITNMTSIDVLESLSNRLHMPYVTPSIPKIHVGVKPGYTLHMRPLYDKAMIEIVKHYRWPKVYYVFDSDDGLMRLQQFYDVINRDNLSIEIDVRRLHDPANSYDLLRQLDARNPGEEKYILLDLSTEKITESLLRQVQNVGMNRVNYHYLLGGLGMDELDLDDFIHGGVNITGFRLLDPERKRIKKVQKEWSRLNPQYWIGAGTAKIKYDAALTMDAVSVVVKGLENMIKKDDKVFQEVFRRGKLYNNDSRGVDCKIDPAVPWVKGTAIMNAFKNVAFEGVTGRVAFDKNGHRKNYTLEVMQMGLNRQTQKIGTWDYHDGLHINGSIHVKFHGKKRLNDTKIITTILSEPYLMIAKQPEDGKPMVGNERYIGFCADLAKRVAEIIGFDYVLQEVKDGKYGAADEGNGQWNGMVGELTRREADLAIAPLTITSFRERVIDFSKPFMRAGISIMIKKPEKQKPGVFSFMDPLSYEIWMCIIFAYIGVSIVLFLVSRFSPYEWQIEDSVQGPTFTNDFTLFNSLWFSLGAFMQQGCDISPRSMSGRIVGSVWWFFTLIIISSYTANLAAFLTVERMRTPIESADDLSKQTEIQYGS